MGSETKHDLLKAVPLFATCRSRELERLSMLTDEVTMPAGRVLFNQGDNASELFIVVEGQVRVERHGSVIATRGPGEFFGEMALVSARPRNATVTATTPIRVLVVHESGFRRLLHDSPKVQLKVLQTLADRAAENAPV